MRFMRSRTVLAVVAIVATLTLVGTLAIGLFV
jgi:hypothetical protein